MYVLNEVSLNIDKIVNQLLPQQIEAALDKVGQVVENEAKKKCGVDSGILRASITHKTAANAVVIGSNVEYAPYHHENNQFLQGAIDENMDKIIKCFSELLEE